MAVVMSNVLVFICLSNASRFLLFCSSLSFTSCRRLKLALCSDSVFLLYLSGPLLFKYSWVLFYLQTRNCTTYFVYFYTTIQSTILILLLSLKVSHALSSVYPNSHAVLIYVKPLWSQVYRLPFLLFFTTY